jgi:hypothetical protein
LSGQVDGESRSRSELDLSWGFFPQNILSHKFHSPQDLDQDLVAILVFVLVALQSAGQRRWWGDKRRLFFSNHQQWSVSYQLNRNSFFG